VRRVTHAKLTFNSISSNEQTFVSSRTVTAGDNPWTQETISLFDDAPR